MTFAHWPSRSWRTECCLPPRRRSHDEPAAQSSSRWSRRRRFRRLDMKAALTGLTPRGRALLAAGVTAFLLAAMLDQQDIMRVGLLAMVLPLLSAASVARTRFRLASGRTLEPARIPAGESASVTVRVENVSHLPTG